MNSSPKTSLARRADRADGLQGGGDRSMLRGAVEFLRKYVPNAQGNEINYKKN